MFNYNAPSLAPTTLDITQTILSTTTTSADDFKTPMTTTTEGECFLDIDL